MSKVKEAKVYQLKITLCHSKPPIWRQVQVKSNINLSKLHQVIQIVMDWTNSHLHQFTINNQNYSQPFPEWQDMLDEKDFKLNQLVTKVGKQFTYTYDFGDGWDHTVLLEKILKPEPKQLYPVCLKGMRACPMEDSGGLWGYYHKLEVVKNPKHEEYEEIYEWMPPDWDTEIFDLVYVNQWLRKGKIPDDLGEFLKS